MGWRYQAMRVYGWVSSSFSIDRPKNPFPWPIGFGVIACLFTSHRDGITHLVMTPLEFLQRLAALVPRPRLHLIRFHGVLAPNATLRSSHIVPGATNQETDSAKNTGQVACFRI